MLIGQRRTGKTPQIHREADPIRELTGQAHFFTDRDRRALPVALEVIADIQVAVGPGRTRYAAAERIGRQHGTAAEQFLGSES